MESLRAVRILAIATSFFHCNITGRLAFFIQGIHDIFGVFVLYPLDEFARPLISWPNHKVTVSGTAQIGHNTGWIKECVSISQVKCPVCDVSLWVLLNVL